MVIFYLIQNTSGAKGPRENLGSGRKINLRQEPFHDFVGVWWKLGSFYPKKHRLRANVRICAEGLKLWFILLDASPGIWRLQVLQHQIKSAQEVSRGSCKLDYWTNTNWSNMRVWNQLKSHVLYVFFFKTWGYNIECIVLGCKPVWLEFHGAVSTPNSSTGQLIQSGPQNSEKWW